MSQHIRVATIAAALLLLALLTVKLAGAGSRLQLIALLGLVLAPLALWWALKRPVLFPYAVYVLLIPFDNLLSFSGSGTVTKFLGLASAAALLFWGLRTRRFGSPSAAVLLWGLAVVWMGGSLAWSITGWSGAGEFQTVLLLFTLYVVVATHRLERRDLRIVMGAVVLGGLAAALYGIAFFAAHPQLRHEGRLFIQIGTSAIDPNHFANALLFPSAVALMWMLGARNLGIKIAGFGVLAILLAAIYASGSRESLLAFAAALGYFLWRTRHRRQLLVIAGCVLVATLAIPTMWARFGAALSTGGAGRVSIWLVGLQAFKEHWLIGAGTGSFAAAYDAAYLQVYQAFAAGFGRASHNLLIHVGVELGLVGLLLFVTAWVSQFRTLGRIRPGDPEFDDRTVVEGALVALTVAALFIDLLAYKYLWLALMTAAQVRAVAEEQASVRFAPGASPSESRALRRSFERA